MAYMTQRHRMALDLPMIYMRAIRARAGFDGVSPSAVVMAAIDLYLSTELNEAKTRIGEAATVARVSADKRRGKKSR